MQMLIKIGDQPDLGYKDGDIVEAFSPKRILSTHAAHICHEKNFPVGRNGYREQDSLLEMYMFMTSRYQFIREGDRVRRLDLTTLDTTYLSNTPNENGEYIDVQLFIDRRMVRSNHLIFGSPQMEWWYGGYRDLRHDDIWEYIEERTENRRDQYTMWPVTPTEKKHFLTISCCGHGDLSHDTICLRRDSLYSDEEDPQLLAKRRWMVPYWDLTSTLDINVDDVRNLDKELDKRHEDNHDSPQLDSTNVDKKETWPQ